MNKERYKQVMNHIQMPEHCEQQILEKIESNAKPVLHRRTWKRNVSAGLAVAACVGVIGMISVSAIQGTNWIRQLFPNSSDEAATAQYAVEQAGNVSAFSADLEDLDAELVSAFADESNLYYAVHLTPKTNDPEKYTNQFTISPTGNQWFTGETRMDLMTTGSTATTPEENGYLFTNKIHLDNGTWKNQTVFKEEIQAQLWQGENYGKLAQNFGVIGTISITIDLQSEPQQTVYTASGQWNNEKGFLNIEQVILQPLTLTIDGTADNQTNRAEQVSVILADGSTVAGEYMSSGYRNQGIVTENLTQVEQFLYLEKPVDPTAVTAVQMDDVTIPLTCKADNTILAPSSMTATLSDFTISGMDGFTVTPLGVISDGTNLAMVMNAAPDDPTALPEGFQIDMDFLSLQVDGKPISEFLDSGVSTCEKGNDGEYVITCKIQMGAFLQEQADVQFDLHTSDHSSRGTVAFHLDNIQKIPSMTYTADGTWKHYVEIQNSYRLFNVQQITCFTSHIKLTGPMDPDLMAQPESVSVILTDGTEVTTTNLQQGKGGTIAGYGILHQPDGTGVLEFDLSQPINPNAVASIKLDDVTISLTKTTTE
ncbi:MAG: hypothetical protein Q4D37_02575 [Oscillospiraceae bacterium]|nr:hypothetical protein [Oscillospiraceae bacterium]